MSKFKNETNHVLLIKNSRIPSVFQLIQSKKCFSACSVKSASFVKDPVMGEHIELPQRLFLALGGSVFVYLFHRRANSIFVPSCLPNQHFCFIAHLAILQSCSWSASTHTHKHTQTRTRTRTQVNIHKHTHTHPYGNPGQFFEST